MAAGDPLDGRHLTLRRVPARYAPASAYASVPALAGARAAVALLHGEDVGPAVVDAQVLAGVDVVVHVDRVGGRRRVTEVGVVAEDRGRAVVLPALVHGSSGVSAGPGAPRLRERIGPVAAPVLA